MFDHEVCDLNNIAWLISGMLVKRNNKSSHRVAAYQAVWTNHFSS
ncbi:hypothetical protein [Rubritalea tangerina]